MGGCLKVILVIVAIVLFIVLWYAVLFGLISVTDWMGDGLWPWEHKPWGPPNV